MATSAASLPHAIAAANGGLVDKQTYRDGMARLAAAVNIITSIGEEGICGFTASAVCSVTDTPPTLLVCVNRAAQSYPTLIASQVLCVNTVGPALEAAAMRFAGGEKSMKARFDGLGWSPAVTGAPMLDGAAVAFDCRIVSSSEVGTHTVFFCEVVAIRQEGEAANLVYFERGFHPIGV